MTRVLHILDHSLPEQSGYAYRSHSILQALLQGGVELDAITGPKQGWMEAAEECIDGVRYRRSNFAKGRSLDGIAGQIRTIAATRKQIARRLRSGRVEVLHAHSPCLNGVACLGLGVPVVYEMRSSWEDAAVSVGATREGSSRYRASRALETLVARRANAIVVICEGLKRDLIGRGIPEERITVVPNALSPAMFVRADARAIEKARRRFGLDNKRVLGFFGSFFEWEGVDQLIRALPFVAREISNVHLLLAGGGRQEAELQRLVRETGLGDRVTFAGRVGHDEIRALYGVAEAMIFPRVANRLTEMVTPIKPLEAMAQGAVVIASDVGGHRELIENGKTGILFPADSAQGLVDAVMRVLQDSDTLSGIRQQAQTFVTTEREWTRVAERYLPLYEQHGKQN